jgi:hypothetical protein
MSLAVCNSVRSVGLDGWVAGMLACQDAQTDKDTLARRAANGQGVYLCFFLKNRFRLFSKSVARFLKGRSPRFRSTAFCRFNTSFSSMRHTSQWSW